MLKDLQKMVDIAERRIGQAIDAVNRIEAMTCDAAPDNLEAAAANASAAIVGGHLRLAKGEGTRAALAFGGIRPRFGGK